jgi:AcrR family transcriptional regulator
MLASVTAPQQAPLREVRKRELVAATRALFDERGVQEAPIEEIARAVGIARGLVYRQFSSKEELFVATIIDYLGELAELLEGAVREAGDDRVSQLELLTEAFAGYCRRYPAFLDCSLSLMRGPAGELQEKTSEPVWQKLGASMARCLGCLAQVLREGRDAGAFDVSEPDFTANALWTQGLGIMHLARIGVGVRREPAGGPALFRVRSEDVASACVESALAVVGCTRRAGERRK